MKIAVTQQNINLGLRGSCTSDPLSLAMKQAGLEKPWVGPTYIAWRKDNKDYFVPTPDDVLEFIEKFDNQMFVEPVELELCPNNGQEG